jgi:hypothetical protein
MRNRTTVWIFGVALAAFGGCDARTLTMDAGSGTAGSGGMTGAAGTSGVAGTSGTAGTVNLPPTCPAACSTPAGTVYAFTSTEEIYAAIAGLWQICAGAGRTFPTAPADTIGVEYTPGSATPTAGGSTVGGNMYYLVQSATGPVRGAGFDYQLTYDVSPEGPGQWQLNMHPMPNSGFGGSFRYSPCPREFEISGGSVSPADRAILIAF